MSFACVECPFRCSGIRPTSYITDRFLEIHRLRSHAVSRRQYSRWWVMEGKNETPKSFCSFANSKHIVRLLIDSDWWRAQKKHATCSFTPLQVIYQRTDRCCSRYSKTQSLLWFNFVLELWRSNFSETNRPARQVQGSHPVGTVGCC